MIGVPIEFLAEFQKSLDSLNDFAKETEKSTKKIQGDFENIQKVVGLVFGAAIVKKGFDAFVDGFKAVTKAGAEYETEVTRLGQSLRITNEFSDIAVRKFIALGDEMQLNTKYTGGQIAEQVALAKTYGLTNRETEKLIRASVDLAAATGKDLNTATEMLAKTYSGQAGQLKKLIPEIQTLSEEQLLNGRAVEIVARAYSGFAQGELGTFNGIIEKIGQNYEDLLEAIGRPITESGGVKQLLSEYNALLVAGAEAATENREGIQDFVNVVINGMFTVGVVTAEAFRVIEQTGRALYTIVQAVIDTFQAFLKSGTAVARLLTGDLKGALSALTDEFAETGEAFRGIGESAVRYNNLRVAIDKVQERVADAAASTKKLADGAGVVSTEFDKAGKSVQRFGKQITGDFEALVKELEKTVGDPIGNITAKMNADIKLVEKAIRAGLTDQIKGAELIGKIRMASEKQIGEERLKQLDLERKRYQEFVGRIKEISANPLRLFSGGEEYRGNQLGLSEGAQFGVAGGLGMLQTILGGKDGAKKFLGMAGSAIGVALAGPAGEALGPIVEILSQGPEEVKKMIREFAQALPDLIQNIIEAIPEVIIELAEQAPLIIERLVDKAPEIIERLAERAPDVALALAKNMPRVAFALAVAAPKIIFELVKGMPKVIGKMIEGAAQFVGKILAGGVQFIGKILEGAGKFVQEILKGAGRFIEELIKGIGNIGGGLFGGIGKGIGGIVGTVGGIVGGAVGGIGRAIGGLFKAEGQPTYMGSPSVNQNPNQSQQINVSLKISNKQLAEAMLEVNRQGYRTA